MIARAEIDELIDRTIGAMTEGAAAWREQTVASKCGIDPATVAAARRSGDLPAFKLGRVWLYRPLHVLAWLSHVERQYRLGTTLCYRSRIAERRQ